MIERDGEAWQLGFLQYQWRPSLAAALRWRRSTQESDGRNVPGDSIYR